MRTPNAAPSTVFDRAERARRAVPVSEIAIRSALLNEPRMTPAEERAWKPCKPGTHRFQPEGPVYQRCTACGVVGRVRVSVEALPRRPRGTADGPRAPAAPTVRLEPCSCPTCPGPTRTRHQPCPTCRAATWEAARCALDRMRGAEGGRGDKLARMAGAGKYRAVDLEIDP